MGRHSAPNDDDGLENTAVMPPMDPLTASGRHYAVNGAQDDAPTDLLPVISDGPQAGTPQAGTAEAELPQAGTPKADVPRTGTPNADAPHTDGPQTGTPSIPTEQSPKPSRAGRNLPAAIGVGVGLGIVGICSLVFYRPSFLAIIFIAVGLGVVELARAIATVEARPPVVPLLAGLAACVFAAWFRGMNGLVVASLVTACGVAVWRLADGAAGYRRDVASALLILLYLPLLAGFATMLVHPHDGAARTLAFLGTVVCSDTGGYASGVLFGRHPLAPVVSKGKTWEGLVGSLLFCAVCGALLLSLTFHQQWWQGVLFGLAIAVTATLGDLGESMIKRDLGIKDMGTLLPGHGGVMDRLDSLLPCAAVAFLLLTAFAPA